MLTTSVPLLLIARGVVGAGMGGGTLAWNLGHHDFASKENANVYMGVHVVLTGVRGATAPILGALLYQHVIGGWVFVLGAALGAAGAIMFVAMRSRMDRTPRDAS